MEFLEFWRRQAGEVAVEPPDALTAELLARLQRAVLSGPGAGDELRERICSALRNQVPSRCACCP